MKTYKINAVYIEVTSRCNLSCPHCYNNSNSCSTSEMDLGQISHILTQCKVQGVRNVSFSGGEPLLWSNLIPAIKQASESDFNHIAIVSNGTLINEKKLNNILKVADPKTLSFQLSLDGSTQHSHELIRGPSSYQKLMIAVKLLSNYNLGYYFHSVIHKYNYTEIDRIIFLARELKGRKVNFSMLKKYGRATSTYDDIGLEKDELLKTYHILNAMPKDNYVSFPSIYYGKCPIFDPSEDTTIDLSIRIDVKGNVYACQNFNSEETSLGNIFSQDLNSIVNETTIDNLSLKLQQYKINSHKCDQCFLNNQCNGGCPAIEYCTEYEGLYSIDCELRRENIKKFISEVACSEKILQK